MLVNATVPISSECVNTLRAVESFSVRLFVLSELRYRMFREKI